MLIDSQKTMIGVGWAITAIMVWSGSLVMLRHGVESSLNAYDLTMLRFGVAAALLAPVALKRSLELNWIKMLGLVAMIVSFGAPYVLLIALSMETASASAAGALNPGVMALVSLLLSWVLLGIRIGIVRLIGLVTAATGIALFVFAAGALAVGHLILVGTGVMWASYGVIFRYVNIPALQATAFVAVGSTVFYLPIYIWFLPKQIFAAPISDVLAQAGFQGILVSIVAIYAFNRSTELLGPVIGTSLPALIPVVTLGLGIVILGESAGAGEFSSALMVTSGLALILARQSAQVR